jgi:hypothetical protein
MGPTIPNLVGSPEVGAQNLRGDDEVEGRHNVGGRQGRVCGGGSSSIGHVLAALKTVMAGTSPAMTYSDFEFAIGLEEASLHRADFDHVRYEMFQQILNAVLQRCRR